MFLVSRKCRLSLCPSFRRRWESPLPSRTGKRLLERIPQAATRSIQSQGGSRNMKIIAIIWIAVGLCVGNIVAVTYQKHSRTPVKTEQKGKVMKAAEEMSEEDMMAFLMLLLLLGQIEIEIVPEPPPAIEDGPSTDGTRIWQPHAVGIADVDDHHLLHPHRGIDMWIWPRWRLIVSCRKSYSASTRKGFVIYIDFKRKWGGLSPASG